MPIQPPPSSTRPSRSAAAGHPPGAVLLLVLAALAACGPSPEDLVRDLTGDAAARGAARQELLLAKERAVDPLLAALVDPGMAAARAEVIDLLASLLLRVEDGRIQAALVQRLRADPDPAVRARVAHALGLQRRFDTADALLAALADGESEVRYQAFVALGLMESKLSAPQRDALAARAADLLGDPHPGVQLEARIRVESAVQDLLQQAAQAVLGAQTVEAESLYCGALARAPGSQRARYRLARFYYDNGQRQRGLDLLRRYGLLLDVPRLRAPPRIDGRLDGDPAWVSAARSDSFYVFSGQHPVALPSGHPTRLYAGYTAEALHLALWCRDDHPDSLVAKVAPGEAGSQVGISLDQSIWTDDVIELFLDADFDHRAYAHIGLNSRGAASPEWIAGDRRQAATVQDWADNRWRPALQVAAHVGDDFWSLECALGFEPGRLPPPRPGAVWGFNAVRTFRGQEYAQWTRTYGGGHSPDDFGVLLFR